MQPNINQEFINSILLEHYCKAKVKKIVFVKLDIRYIYYFPEYAKYFGRALILLQSIYGMANYGRLFAYKLTESSLEAGFTQSQAYMSIYYK